MKIKYDNRFGIVWISKVCLLSTTNVSNSFESFTRVLNIMWTNDLKYNPCSYAKAKRLFKLFEDKLAQVSTGFKLYKLNLNWGLNFLHELDCINVRIVWMYINIYSIYMRLRTKFYAGIYRCAFFFVFCFFCIYFVQNT